MAVCGGPLLNTSGIIDWVSADLERLARTAYEAHRGAHPGYRPSWEDATEEEQEAWKAAVGAISGAGDVTLADGAPAQSLVVKTGGEIRAFHTEFTAGRQGTLTVNDEHASGHHVVFQFAHGLWWVEDLGSTNGTFLNNRRIYNAQRLKKGDKIRIGRSVMTIVSA
jgi:pSer/pThr/pTyr-binding forkhead associated (FHA) protein